MGIFPIITPNITRIYYYYTAPSIITRRAYYYTP